MTDKDKKIIEDAKREGIPIFILTAKDKLSVDAIQEYKDVCNSYGCDYDHILDIGYRIDQFESWQRCNQDKVKLPD